jgi:hypothetical protein
MGVGEQNFFDLALFPGEKSVYANTYRRADLCPVPFFQTG